MITLHVYMMPFDGGERARVHKYDRVDEWGYVLDGSVLFIKQGQKVTNIFWNRIDRLTETVTNVVELVSNDEK